MIVRLKDGVSLDKVHHKIYLAVGMIAPTFEGAGLTEMVLTAGNEPGHTTNPDPKRQFHRLPDGTAQAIDVRSKNVPVALKDQVLAELKEILGPSYFVDLEFKGQPNEHYHIQYEGRRS